MTNTDKMDDDNFFEIARNIGYDSNNLNEFSMYKTRISEMDLWDRAKILFFGKTWEQY